MHPAYRVARPQAAQRASAKQGIGGGCGTGEARTRRALPGESTVAPGTGALTRNSSRKAIPPPRAGKGGEQAMDGYGLTVEIRGEPGHVLITVAGEVDIATVPQLQERLAVPAASGRPLIVDLGLVTFIDAAGLGMLASAASQAAAHGASLHAVCARHQVRRLFNPWMPPIPYLPRTMPAPAPPNINHGTGLNAYICGWRRSHRPSGLT
jgi:anti-anti-sigma factor